MISALTGGVFLLAVILMYTLSVSPVIEGKADLAEHNFQKESSVTLDGEWEFYWNKLLYPSDFLSDEAPEMSAYAMLPGSWAEDGRYPDEGYATYRALIDVDKNQEELAMRFRYIVNAYRVYVNGELMASVGTISADKDEHQSDLQYSIVELPNHVPSFEIVIQVANFDYARGGIRESIVLGKYEHIESGMIRLTVIQIFCIGIAFAIGLFYLMVFVIRKKEWASLFFSLFCIIIALRTAIWGEIPLRLIFPNTPLSVGVMINYITGYNIMPCIMLFLMHLYPHEVRKKTVLFLLIPNLLFEFLLFTPPAFFSKFNNIYYILMAVYMLYTLLMLSRAVANKRSNSGLILIAVTVFYLTAISDVFHYKGIGNIDSSFLVMFGTIVVILAMSYVQSREQAHMRKMLEDTNRQLVEADKLRDTIMETEMAFLRAQIKPHFLFNAINAIANIAQKNGQKGSQLMIDLAMYLRHSFTFENIDKMSTLEKELEYIENYIHIEAARFGEKIHFEQRVSVPEDTPMPVLVLQPLVENAIRHGISKKSSGGNVVLTIEEVERGIRVEVSDDGLGMKEDILHRVMAGTNCRQVGLKNIQSRLLRLYGAGLKITSQQGQGTCVAFIIPKGEQSHD